jgi:hypothetical protein
MFMRFLGIGIGHCKQHTTNAELMVGSDRDDSDSRTLASVDDDEDITGGADDMGDDDADTRGSDDEDEAVFDSDNDGFDDNDLEYDDL